MHPSVCRCLGTDEDSLVCLAATAKLILEKKKKQTQSVSHLILSVRLDPLMPLLPLRLLHSVLEKRLDEAL